MDSGLATFTLDLRGNKYECSAGVPVDPVPLSSLLPVINAVADLVVQVHSSGAPVSCRSGCGACCRQHVPVTHSEARRISSLVASLPESRRRIIESRFAAAVSKLHETGLFDILTGAADPGPEYVKSLAFRYFDLGIACPFLENESCSIYEDRPLRCREYLVTSPAALCAAPEGQPVRTIPFSNWPSKALASIGRGDEPLNPPFLTLTLALEWAALHPDAETPLHAPEILRNFLVALSSPVSSG